MTANITVAVTQLENSHERGTSQRLVHCNFGWEGSHDGYYYVGAFNTAKSPVTLGVSSTGPNDFSNDNEIMMYML